MRNFLSPVNLPSSLSNLCKTQNKHMYIWLADFNARFSHASDKCDNMVENNWYYDHFKE